MSGSVILINLLGGIALLLWGLRTVESGMTRAFGNLLKPLVGRAFANRFTGFGSGLGITLLLQSSTATTLFISSFLTKGSATTSSAAIAALLGALLGTALVANVLVYGTAVLIPILFVIGIMLYRVSKVERVREAGRAVMGIGLVLLALQLIVAASTPLREAAGMEVIFKALANDAPLALLCGFFLAWLTHSSIAIVLLVASVAGGPVDLATAIEIVLGANLGSAIPPVLATWKTSVAARRIPVANILLRLIGLVLVLPLLDGAVAQLEHLAVSPLIQTTSFHLFFNLALAIVFLPFAGLVAEVIKRLLPDKPAVAKTDRGPQYLDTTALESPSVALAYAVRDAVRMGEIAEQMLGELEVVLRHNRHGQVAKIRATDDVLDRYYSSLVEYLGKISSQELSEADALRCNEILMMSINLEHIGDLLEGSIGLRIERLQKDTTVLPPEVLAQLLDMFGQTRECLKLAMAVFLTGELALARNLLALKVKLAKRERRLTLEYLGKSNGGGGDSVSTAFVDLLGDLKRVVSYASSVAYPIADRAGALRSSRLATPKSEQHS